MQRRSDVDRSIERLQNTLHGRRVTRQQLREARASNPATDSMSETSILDDQSQVQEDNTPTLSATVSRQFHAEREGALSFSDPDFRQPPRGEPTVSPQNLSLLGAVGGVLFTPEQRTSSQMAQRGSEQAVSPATNPNIQQLIDQRNERYRLEHDNSTPDQWGGARPRNQQGGARQNDLTGMGNYVSQTENTRVVSPARAIDLTGGQGRYLLDRLQRVEQTQRQREAEHDARIRDINRRHEEERQLWQRQMEQLARQMQGQRIADNQGGQVVIDQLPVRQNPEPPRNTMQTPPNVQRIRDQQAAAQQPPQQMQPQPAQLQGAAPVNQQPPQHAGAVQQQQPPVQQVHQPAQNANNVPQHMYGGWWYPPVQPWMVPQQQQNFRNQPPGGQQQLGPPRGPWDYYDRPRVDKPNIKIKMFKGNHVESFKTMIEDLAQARNWSEQEKKLQLKANVEDWIRLMFKSLGPDTTFDEMMNMLVMRFGVNMTGAEVQNALLKIERKPGEDLYTLADRVRNLVARADFTAAKRRHLERHHFYTALRTNSELQHWVGRYDDEDNPDIQLTLQLAVQWEQQHGTQHKNDKVRQTNIETTDDTETDSSVTTTESVNKVGFIRLRDLQSEDAKTIAKHHNQVVEAMKKYSKLINDDSAATSTRSSSGWSNRSSTSQSSRSSRSSRDRSRSKSGRYNKYRRSRSRNKSNKYDKRSGDKKGKENRDNKYKKKSRDDKNKRETRANKVETTEKDETESQNDSDRSRSTSPSGSEAGSQSE